MAQLTQSFFYLLLLLQLTSISINASPSIPTMHEQAAAAAERHKRKVSELDSSAGGAFEYMEKLNEKYSDSEGHPTLVNDDDPTSVWCIMDRDMLQKVHRPRPSPPAKCTVLNRFIFNWASVAKSEHEPDLPVQKSFIRAYLKPIQRLLKKHGPTQVDIDIQVGLLGDSTRVPAGNQRVTVSSTTSWQEIDVTAGLQSLWPPKSNNYDLEFIVTLRVDCKRTKKVPAIFIDPTEIPLSNAVRRERHRPFQPLLLVFFKDDVIRDIVRNETISMDAQIEEYSESFNTDSKANLRGKRSARGDPCRTENFPVVFTDLYLFNILAPMMFNVRTCTGSCSHYMLTEDHHLGTNHANIMAGAYAVFEGGHTGGFIQTPTEPCCVPIRYSSKGLIVMEGSDVMWKVYPAMRVEECGCR